MGKMTYYFHLIFLLLGGQFFQKPLEISRLILSSTRCVWVKLQLHTEALPETADFAFGDFSAIFIGPLGHGHFLDLWGLEDSEKSCE